MDSLPSELLCIIFHFVKSIQPATANSKPQAPQPEPGPSRYQYRELQWIREVSHVCQHWRQTALGDATLWTDISVSSSPHWAKEMVVRSQTQPGVSISCDFGVSDDTAQRSHLKLCAALLEEVWPRVEKLNFTRVDRRMLIDLFYHKEPHTGKAAVLHKLKDFSLSRSVEYSLVVLDNDLEDGFFFDPSTLQKLSLVHYRINWEFLGLCQAVTHLQIEHEPLDGLDRQTSIVSALKNMPKLQELSLRLSLQLSEGIDSNFILLNHNTDAASSVSRPDVSHPLILSDLRSIELNHPSAVWLRSIVESPAPDRRRRWQVATIDFAFDSMSNNSAFLPVLLQHIDDTSVISAQISYSIVTHTGICHRHQIEFCFNNSNQAPLLSYCLDTPAYPGWIPSTMRSILDLFFKSGAYANLEHLYLCGFPTMPLPQDLARTVGMLPSLTSVKVASHGSDPSRFLSALVEGTDENLPFVRLQSVEIEGAKFITAASERLLLDCLERRHAMGLQLAELILPAIYVPASYARDMEALQRVVERVKIRG